MNNTQNGYGLYELIEADEAMHRAAVEAFSEFMDIVNGGSLPAPLESASMLLDITIDRFGEHNEGLPCDEQWPVPAELTPHQLALLIMVHYEVRALSWMDEREDPDWILFVYQPDGPDRGIYTDCAYGYAEEFEPLIEWEKESRVVDWLMEEAERGVRCVREELVAVNNGIFNCRTKALMPFSPEYIFLAKSPVNYVPAAVKPVLHDAEDGTDWDVETWVDGLCADPADTPLLWQAIKDAITPHADRDTIVTLYPEHRYDICDSGAICGLMRGLCGNGNYSPRPLINNLLDIQDAPYNYARPSIVDEGELKERYVETCLYAEYARVKKEWGGWNNPSDAFRHHGFAVQCVGELPRQDFGCFYGEILPIPLAGNPQGRERTYIKDDYIRRKEVLEYVLWKVLHM